MTPQHPRWHSHHTLLCPNGHAQMQDANPRRVPEPCLGDAEIRVLALLAAGATHDTTARRLGLSPRTVRRRLQAARECLGVTTAVETIVWAAKHHLV